MEVDLDNVEELGQIDASGMLTVVEWFPQQVREALEIGGRDVNLPTSEGLRAVVILGMGGSGISGDVTSALVADSLPVPVIPVKGYGLPALVGPDTLVFAVSYSGNTEETLECLDEALNRGARAVVVSSGGRIAEIAEERGLPLFLVPPGLQPRASIGYLSVPILSAMERMGMVNGVVDKIERAAAMLDERANEYRVSSPLDDNPTKRLAKDLLDYLPIIYGSEGPIAVAAKRWKTQFNENAKVPAFDNWFPELNHNETVGWQNLAEVCSKCHLIVLRATGEHPRVAKRIDITIDLIRDYVGHVAQICARGSNEVERLFDLIYFGDFTSVYLALAQGQDPTPVTRIEVLKQRMAEDGA
jgi:glucose/mannose-6-phosphate isomerase